MTPRDMALAYRIWAYADPRGWNVTIPELADEMGVSHQKMTGLLHVRGWLGRVRRGSPRGMDNAMDSRSAALLHMTREIAGNFQISEAWE